MAHARVASIKTFEKVLQDNTPFTSINDSEALAEYLTQINRKGDLVMEELRRVTQEKDNFKKKTDEAEKELAILKDKLAMLDVAGPGAEHSKIPDAAVAATDVEPADMSDRPHTPTSTKSPIFRVLTAFSPRHKDEAPKADKHGGSEDLFSVDSEIRHLQAENEKKAAEILQLRLPAIQLIVADNERVARTSRIRPAQALLHIASIGDVGRDTLPTQPRDDPRRFDFRPLP